MPLSAIMETGSQLVLDDHNTLPSHVPRGSESAPEIITATAVEESRAAPLSSTGAEDSHAAPRRQWTVLRQLDGILDLRHLKSDSDNDQIIATTEPAATYLAPSGVRSCACTCHRCQ